MKRDREKARFYNALYVLVVLLICVLALVFSMFDDPDSIVEMEKAIAEDELKNLQMITVYVTGEVVNPGLHEIPKGERVMAAIEKAGGVTENADIEGVNLAKILSDGDQVKVPAMKKTSGGSSTSKQTTTSKINSGGKTEQKVDINCGDPEKYMTIQGMTEDVAHNMAEYVKAYAGFQTVEELQLIEGMTPSLYKKLEAYFGD